MLSLRLLIGRPMERALVIYNLFHRFCIVVSQRAPTARKPKWLLRSRKEDVKQNVLWIAALTFTAAATP